MRSLLSADLYRLVRSKSLYVGMLCLVLMEVWLMKNSIGGDRAVQGMEYQNFFSFTMFLPFAAAAFCGLFIGADFSYKTIRNKLICGHTKGQIYLSHALVTVLATVCFCAAPMGAGALYGLIDGRMFTLSNEALLGYILCSLASSIAAGALAVLVAALFPNRSVGILVSLLAAFVLFCGSQIINNSLSQPETVPQFTQQTLGDNVTIYAADPNLPEVPNPDYPTGIKRAALELLWDFLPACQATQLSTVTVESFGPLLLFSVLFFALVTFIGVALFCQKDIK